MTRESQDLVGLTKELQQKIRARVTAAAGIAAGAGGADEPACDVVETPDAYILAIEFPGIDPDSVEIDVKDRTVRVTATSRPDGVNRETRQAIRVDRGADKWVRSVELPQQVEAGTGKRSYDNGVLRVTLSKSASGGR
ncbi:Hsp20/alpha crystallin family protein [bacterium]|nr:Hsp20/alpha crystallin family protein [bacterium]